MKTGTTSILGCALALILPLTSARAQGPWTPPNPIPVPIKFEELCLLSGGATGSFMPTSKPGGAFTSKKLLEAGTTPILFTFNLATGSSTVFIRWTNSAGIWQPEDLVRGPYTLTVVSTQVQIRYDDALPIAWCTRATPASTRAP